MAPSTQCNEHGFEYNSFKTCSAKQVTFFSEKYL